jgi:hypothetical protein
MYCETIWMTGICGSAPSWGVAPPLGLFGSAMIVGSALKGEAEK